MGTARYGHGTVVAADGRVYVFGGNRGGTGILNTTEALDPATGAWSMRAPMPVALMTVEGAALADGRVLCLGGYPSSGTPTNAAYIYNPPSNTWTATAPMAQARFLAAAARGSDGRVYVFGGRTSTVVTVSEAYDPTTNSWSPIRSPVTSRASAEAVAGPDGRIYLFGGSSDAVGNVPVNTVEIYDPVANSWSAGPPLPAAVQFHAGALGRDGQIYLAGGYVGATYLSSVVAFAPASGSYTNLPSMAQARSYFGMVALPDGRVLAIGGLGTRDVTLGRTEAYVPPLERWF